MGDGKLLSVRGERFGAKVQLISTAKISIFENQPLVQHADMLVRGAGKMFQHDIGVRGHVTDKGFRVRGAGLGQNQLRAHGFYDMQSPTRLDLVANYGKRVILLRRFLQAHAARNVHLPSHMF